MTSSSPVTGSGALATITEQRGTDAFANLDAWWRAANYLSVGQIYLRDNPLLRRPLAEALPQVPPGCLG